MQAMRFPGRLFCLVGVCLWLAACGVTSTGAGGETGTDVATATPATTTTPAPTSAPVATATPASPGTATIGAGVNCGQIFQSANGTVAPPAPNYGKETACFTDAFTVCHPAFLEFIATGIDAVQDYTLTALPVKGVCQVHVAEHFTSSSGSTPLDQHYFYYCTGAMQKGAQAIMTGCDTHHTNGTIAVPASA